MKTKRIIWDFNGTIINDLPLSHRSINKVLKKRSLSLIPSEDAYREAFCFPIIKYYENLGMDFTKEPYKVPADEWVALYNEGIDTIELTDGVFEVIKKLDEFGISQMVLSASERKMLTSQIDFYKLTDYFDIVLGTDDVYGGGKVEMAKRWMAETGTSLSDTVFIGDTDHDFETAKALGCRCILFSGGHMSRAKLEKFGVPVIDCIEELFRFI